MILKTSNDHRVQDGRNLEKKGKRREYPKIHLQAINNHNDDKKWTLKRENWLNFVDFCFIFIFNMSRTIPPSVEGIFMRKIYLHLNIFWPPVWDIFLIVSFVRGIDISIILDSYSFDSPSEDFYLGAPFGRFYIPRHFVDLSVDFHTISRLCILSVFQFVTI